MPGSAASNSPRRRLPRPRAGGTTVNATAVDTSAGDSPGDVVLRALRIAPAATGRGPEPDRYGPARLGVVTALWLCLLVINPDFSWVAFPLFFLDLQLPRTAPALADVLLSTAAVVVAQWTRSGQPTLAALLGPAIGALFAVVMGSAYSALHRQRQATLRWPGNAWRRCRAPLQKISLRRGGLSAALLLRRWSGSLDVRLASACSEAARRSAAGGGHLQCLFRVDTTPVPLHPACEATLLRAANPCARNHPALRAAQPHTQVVDETPVRRWTRASHGRSTPGSPGSL